MSQDFDVVVVGAGAAGLAAAKTALSLGLTAQIFEVNSRIGGRAYTHEILPGMPWDQGAYWLHDAENNGLAKYAVEIGFALDETPRHFYLWGPDGWADAATIRERDAYFDAAFDAIDGAGHDGRDIPASEVIPPHPRFRTMFEAWYAALNGHDPEDSSTLDESRYVNGGNWRVRPGYGALVATYGRGVPVALSTAVRHIRWRGAHVEVETTSGTVRCRAVVVTASTTAMLTGGLRFDPALPAEVLAAFDGVPVGTAEKVALAYTRDIFGMPANSHLHYIHDTLATTRFHIKPGGNPIAVAYLAGKFAAELEAAGSDAMIDFAEGELVKVFGAGIRQARAAAVATHWRSDPYIRGGYSSARPGAANLRPVLFEPVGERIFFAGEACSVASFGTVQGAHASGVRAAHAIAALVRKRKSA